QRAAQRRYGPKLGRVVEVDQQIAAEDRVVWLGAREEILGEHIAVLEAYRAANQVVHAIAVRAVLEIALTEREVRAAERVVAVDPPPRVGKRAFTDVHGFDREALGRKIGVEQRHRQRVRLFARGAGHAQ